MGGMNFFMQKKIFCLRSNEIEKLQHRLMAPLCVTCKPNSMRL
jgi:hypothetical protein